MSDLLVIGGGVIGLSIAYEAAGRGRYVRVIDAGVPGREASWAGAGILPPAGEGPLAQLEQLVTLSNRRHAELALELLDATGIDNGYRRTGAIYLARQPEHRAHLTAISDWASTRQIIAEPLTQAGVTALEPAVVPSGSLLAAYHVPDECQIRNPRHLKALLAGCVRRGVEIFAGTPAEDFEVRGDHVVGVQTPRGTLSAEQYCLTTGSWTAALARRLGLELAIRPIRGQMALLAQASPSFTHIINEGPRYLVPRADGHVLVGSTEEDAGFDRSTTAGAIGELLRLAFSLVPRLTAAQLERSWAGLRPATADGLPYLGRDDRYDNLYIAAGHFRGGLQLSAGTALVIDELLAGQRTSVDLDLFSPNRTATLPGGKPRRPAPVS